MAYMRLNTTHQWWTKSRHWTHMFLVNLSSACILQVEWFYLEVNSPHFKSAWMSKGHLSTWTCIGKRKTKAMVCPMIHYFPVVFHNSWLHTFFLASHWGFFGKSMAALLHPAALVSKSPRSFRLLERFQSWRLWLWTSLWKSALGTIRDWQAAGKPSWLISEINSYFLKTTFLNRCGKNQI